jgi:hypothetical protein
MLTRAVGAWLLVGLPVIAARIWWSVAGAVTSQLEALRTDLRAVGREADDDIVLDCWTS